MRFVLFLLFGLVEGGNICCILHLQQFTANQTLRFLYDYGAQNFTNTVNMRSFDVVNNREYSATYDEETHELFSEEIDDYNKHITYSISGNQCLKYPSTGTIWDDICVEDNLEFQRNTTLGYGEQAVPISIYGFNLKFGVVRLAVTPDCIPAVETSQLITQFGSMMMFSEFTGVSDGIKNMSVFIPPPSCNHTELLKTPPPSRVNSVRPKQLFERL